ncbi:Sporulation related domain protein [Devosia equisanguinis]|uniref:Sporulation related domain protein n=1 Tax=Devosia equisanguinis TaxID=2490941 RepID=A0A3S4GKA0_9HYPH|nr:SPOR domain-containing protein [Devosia equisanguinis]VDS06686.1 Sporulation related domain protein [Devosia equisanguinis]
MTSAKPKPMAGQTEAPDDLIAELARLMADDARTDTPAQPAAPQVRIPGADAPAVERPAPRFVAPSPQPAPAPQPTRNEPVMGAPSVRIPGETAPAPKPAANPATEPDPFRFDFDLNLGAKKAGPASPLMPEPRPTPAAQPEAVSRPVQAVPAMRAEEPQVDAFDHDSIADLIAAELAADLPDERSEPQQAIPVVNGPARGEDVFGVPPVFGLATSSPVPPAPARVEPAMTREPQPRPEPVFVEPEVLTDPTPMAEAAPEPSFAQVDPDALTEIERLVGPAVHLENPPPPQQQSTPSPALRSLATPTLPPRTEPVARKPVPADSLSVDEAILAAAAATGAKIEWVESPTHEPEVEERVRAPRRRFGAGFGFNRAVAGPLVAVALLAVAGGGLYWVLGNTSAPSGPAPLLVAESNAVKEVPAVDPEATTAQSVVFNEMAGGNNGEGEQIVSRDQTDVAAVTQEANFDPNQDGLVNRKVRTVTVRPDGTIVSGTDNVAGTSMLPVDRPDVPDVPGADFSTPDLLANPANGTTQAVAAVDPTPAPTPTVTPVTPGSSVQAVDPAGNVIPGKMATIPRQRPADFAQRVAALQNAAPTAPVTQTTTPAATTTTTAPVTQPSGVASTVNSAPAYVQLSSQRSEEAARQSAADIVRRFGPVFGGTSLEVQRVDLGERGIFYRVRAPADSLQSANMLCNNIKAAGGDCFTM